MQIKLAKTAGFCFGVNRAVELLYDKVEAGEQVCTLGPIIHNAQLVGEIAPLFRISCNSSAFLNT